MDDFMNSLKRVFVKEDGGVNWSTIGSIVGGIGGAVIAGALSWGIVPAIALSLGLSFVGSYVGAMPQKAVSEVEQSPVVMAAKGEKLPGQTEPVVSAPIIPNDKTRGVPYKTPGFTRG